MVAGRFLPAHCPILRIHRLLTRSPSYDSYRAMGGWPAWPMPDIEHRRAPESRTASFLDATTYLDAVGDVLELLRHSSRAKKRNCRGAWSGRRGFFRKDTNMPNYLRRRVNGRGFCVRRKGLCDEITWREILKSEIRNNRIGPRSGPILIFSDFGFEIFRTEYQVLTQRARSAGALRTVSRGNLRMRNIRPSPAPDPPTETSGSARN
jgi:hypothetical protein